MKGETLMGDADQWHSNPWHRAYMAPKSPPGAWSIVLVTEKVGVLMSYQTFWVTSQDVPSGAILLLSVAYIHTVSPVIETR